MNDVWCPEDMSLHRRVHKSRDWSGLPGYVSMRERPMWMKRSDWESLIGLNGYRRMNATLSSRRFGFQYKTRWRDTKWIEAQQKGGSERFHERFWLHGHH